MPTCHVDDEGWLVADPGCPFYIIKQPLPEASTQLWIKPWSIILHSNAGPRKTSGEDLWRYMARADITGECHANVETAADGRGIFRQMMPFTRRADCNAKANAWFVKDERVGAISFETQDEGAATLASTPWTPGQRLAIVEAMKALRDRYRIPMERCTAWNDQGVGAHRDFPEWSIYVGKTCPGDMRVAQIGRMLEDINTPPEDEEEMLEYVLIPKHPDAKPWWPWLACYTSGVVRPLGPTNPSVPRYDVTDIGQYRRICAAANIQLVTEHP